MQTKTIMVGNSIEALEPGEDQVPNPTTSGAKIDTASIDLTVLHTRKKQIIDHMRMSYMTFDINGEVADPEPVSEDTELEHHAPVVFIVSGPGGNGKDTFINFVARSCAARLYTSVEQVYGIAEQMAELTAVAYEDTAPEIATEIRDSVTKKTDKYRQLLADVKTIWSKYYNTPYTVMYNHINDTMSAVICGENVDCIFLHVRELPEEIDNVIDDIESRFGLICITMEVIGLVDSTEYKNSCDSHVDDYTYDLVIKNHPGDLTMFSMQGYIFATLLKAANELYGVPVSVLLEDTTNGNNGQYDTSPVSVNDDATGIGFSI